MFSSRGLGRGLAAVPAAATLLLVIVIVIVGECGSLASSSDIPDRGISRQQLENWASKFGNPLFEFGRSATKYNELLGRFQNSRESRVEAIKLENLLPEINKDITEVLHGMVTSIEKLAHTLENRALEWTTSSPEKRRVEKTGSYLNAKKMSWGDSGLSYETLFGTKVHPEQSSVHVPTSIYEDDKEVLEALTWSSVMDETFKSNRDGHPFLHWQYFGSSVGFMRQFPGAAWPNSSQEVPDLYDCRFRPWYVGAANRPKNIVILLDVSGSMTGQRREIARHVVYTILDTLTENDFVAVFNFSKEIHPVLPCFNKSLVQANLEYIREIKEALDQDRTTGLADFPLALNHAFNVLDGAMKENESSAGCNNAIMLVTDGAPYNYEEVFAARQSQLNPVRIFTYLTGKEVTDFREVRFMACTNQGYFVHISTLSEVQEQVLKYLPVMSRPLVMSGGHDIYWTPIYADMVNVVESDWAWARRLAEEQRARSEHFKLIWAEENGEQVGIGRSWTTGAADSADDDDETTNNVHPHRGSRRLESPINFVVSASIPVFDLRNSSYNAELERPAMVPVAAALTNATVASSGGEEGGVSSGAGAGPEKERIAKFLGVAGTDIPQTELKRLLKPFRLGVNGYGFIVNNNGHVVLHPDWRPEFEDHLKPNYNAVDMAEVELMDSGHHGRNNDSHFLEMRSEIVRQDRNYRPSIPVRIHQDSFRRVAIRKHRYEYDQIRGTPYSLVLVAPEKMNWFHGEIEIYSAGRNDGIDVTQYFDHPNSQDHPRRWTVNPKWHYCEFIQTERSFPSKEDIVLHFLREIQRTSNGWPWRNTGVGIKNKQKREDHHGHRRDIYDCDKMLMQSLVFDANVTDVFTSSKLWKFNKNDSQIIQIYGALMAFIATRSGLTRWVEFDKHQPNLKATHPKLQFPGATDELWYQRAVDRYALDPHSFVFSVPVHDGNAVGENLKVTATRAMFVRKNGWEAPVAVVGIQFDHNKWAERFFEITGLCIDGSTDCRKTCSSEEFDCFVLDDNGFILITENGRDVGKFFGQVDGMVMEMLINSDVYKRVRVVDYQAVCLRTLAKSSVANFLRTPIAHLTSLMTWMLMQMSSLALQLGLDTLISPTWAEAMAQYLESGAEEEGEVVRMTSTDQASINKTKLRPCDTEYDLYTYGPSYNTHNFSYHGLLTKCGHNCDGYFNVHYIPHTNLILVVTDGRCRCGHNNTSLEGREVEYPTQAQVAEGEGGGLGGGGSGSNGEQRTVERCTRPKLQLTRKRPAACIPINPEEKVIRDDYCGGGARSAPHHSLLLPLSCFLLVVSWEWAWFAWGT